jgi:hypothetical protein
MTMADSIHPSLKGIVIIDRDHHLPTISQLKTNAASMPTTVKTSPTTSIGTRLLLERGSAAAIAISDSVRCCLIISMLLGKLTGTAAQHESYCTTAPEKH